MAKPHPVGVAVKQADGRCPTLLLRLLLLFLMIRIIKIILVAVIPMTVVAVVNFNS